MMAELKQKIGVKMRGRLAGKMKNVDSLHLIQGKGDGYMNCYRCGVRMTIAECGKNKYEGKTWDKGFRVVSWCDECYNNISG